MKRVRINQEIYVLASNGVSYRKARIIALERQEGVYGDEKLNPARYMSIVAQYMDSSSRGTVTFYPEDFGRIVFTSKKEVIKTIKG